MVKSDDGQSERGKACGNQGGHKFWQHQWGQDHGYQEYL